MESRKSVLCLSVLICAISVRINAAQFDGQNQRNPQSTNIDKYDILLQRVIRLEVLEAQRQLSSAHPTNNGNKDNIFFRTCNEARLANPLLNSGMYWIDPDGQGIGDNPINVYCDMATGTTSVPHNNENNGFVKQCADPGCHTVDVKYLPSERQIIALADLSLECRQSINYDCNEAPLEANGVPYGWWLDRQGNQQFFWSGGSKPLANQTNKSGSYHTCQCGIDRNCIDNNFKCNCDAKQRVQRSDFGIINDKSILPVTQLHFGGILPRSTASADYTLGRFNCSGRPKLNSTIPNSCHELWWQGNQVNGIYSVIGSSQLEAVFCDFSKLYNQQGFQTWIGYENIKTSPTYFYVEKNTSHSILDKPIPFEIEKLNIGKAMNLNSGIFKAPRRGKYFFSATGVLNFTPTSSQVNIALMWSGKNGLQADYANGNVIGEFVGDFETFAIQSTLDLNAGDRIWLEMRLLPQVTSLRGSNAHISHFTGWLLDEQIRVN